MLTTLAKVVAALAIAFSLTLGTVTAASAAPTPHSQSISSVTAPQAAATLVARVAPPRGYVFNKTMAFLGCITGVGVPIGVGWAILSSPAAVAAIAKGGPLPASVGGTVYKAVSGYWWYIKGTCGYALR
jgi:hypothetical protein